MNYLQKYQPKTFKAYGGGQHVAVTKNFVKMWKSDMPFAKAILYYGPPGCGKTTLVKVVSRETGWPLVETNASMDHGKKVMARIMERTRAETLGADHRILFFDEIDALRKRDQSALLRIINDASDPIFLACNDITKIDKGLQAACLTLQVPSPSKGRMLGLAEAVMMKETGSTRVKLPTMQGIQSYRHLLNSLESGTVTEAASAEATFEHRIKRRLSGATDAEIRPSEFWAVGLWIHDNTHTRKAADWDRWMSRYRKVGKPMEKYAQHVLSTIHCPEVEFPWSLKIKVDKPEKKKKDDATPVAEEKPDPMGEYF